MLAKITGSDDLSKRILIDLNSGMKVSQIPEHYPVSLDQAKKLSRLNKMLNLANEHLDKDLYNRLQQLGIKSLPLSRLFRNYDWGGIIEILSVVTSETTRDELQLLIDALNEKRERIREFKEKSDLRLQELEKEEQTLQEKERKLLRLQEEMNEYLQIFKDYPKSIRSFLNEHLGIFQGKLALAKRLHENWQQHLIKKEIIEYDRLQDVYFLKDFNSFIELLKYHRWESDKNMDKKEKPVASFSDSIDSLKQDLKEIHEKKLAIENELMKIKHKTTHSYMKMAEASEYLSTVDLKRHKEMQLKALKWLFNRDFIAMADLPLPNGKKADIFAYNEFQIIIFEIKVSVNDLMTDYNWTEYLPYCHDFFFLTPDELKEVVVDKIKPIKCGQFIETDTSIRLIHPDERNIEQVEGDGELKYMATRFLSRKFIYGY
jgi:hypothetical protein